MNVIIRFIIVFTTLALVTGRFITTVHSAEIDIESLIQETNEQIGAIKALDVALDENLSLKESLQREQVQIQADVAVYKVEVERHKQENSNYSQYNSETSSYCSGTFKEPEYSKRVSECAQRKSYLDNEESRLKSRAKIIDDLYIRIDGNAKENDRKEMRRYEEGQRLLNEREKHLKRLKYLKGYLTRLKGFADANEDVCAKLSNLQDVHCCMSALWDGRKCPGIVIPTPPLQ